MRKAAFVSIVAASWVILSAAPLSATALAATAGFAKTDTTTEGSWVGAYGADGYFVSQDASTKVPGFAQVTFSGQANWTWASSTTALPAVQKPENPNSRIAGTWFAWNSLIIDVNLTDGLNHQVALYALDWDSTQRGETINVRDASTGAVLDSRILSAGSFHNGAYLVWNVQGHVQFEVVRTAGANAVISGVFFDPSTAAQSSGILAVPNNTFLSSLGVNTHINQGYSEKNYEPMFQYTGIRNTRDGYAPGVDPYFLTLHRNTGTLINIFAPASGDITGPINTAQNLANAGALLSLEGPNEPNNFMVYYNGQWGGGGGNWVPVAQYQRDFYAAAKASPTLKTYPVFGLTEGGAEVQNVGLQFLTIPAGAATVMPIGTKYADYANTHNYVTDVWSYFQDNQAWSAADPTLLGMWDGLAVEYGLTWSHNFPGYSNAQLQTLPRVATETGWGTLGANALNEAQQGKLFLDVYLAQFKRGWRYTFIYQMCDNEGGDMQGMGLYHTNGTPKLAATYIHNFTMILADKLTMTPGSLNYSIAGEPATVHDLLMQRSDGTFYLAVWDERAHGAVDSVTVNLGGTHASVNVYDPTVGTAPVRTQSNVSSVPLTLSDHPLILAISGS